MYVRRYPAKIAWWGSSSKVKKGRKHYPKLVVALRRRMAFELEDLIGKPAIAYRNGSRLIVEVELTS